MVFSFIARNYRGLLLTALASAVPLSSHAQEHFSLVNAKHPPGWHQELKELAMTPEDLEAMRPDVLEEEAFPLFYEKEGGRALTTQEMVPYFKEALARARQGGKTWMIWPASMAVGLMYDYGYGTPEDDVQALHWYRKAIDSGQWPNVYSYIGRMYRDGRGGVEKDLMQAFRFYLRSCHFYRILIYGREIEMQLTPAQQAMARKLSDTPPGEYTSRWCYRKSDPLGPVDK